MSSIFDSSIYCIVYICELCLRQDNNLSNYKIATMITLIINDSLKKSLLHETSFGGQPIREINQFLEWPKCKTCNSDLQYQGKIKTDIGFEMIFMCNADPGMCDEWDAESGGNKVVIVNSDKLEFFNPNDPKVSLRETEYGTTFIEMEAEKSYDDARENWNGNKSDVLGKLYGEPSWIQGDETPICNGCNKPMRFVAQLEEGPDHRTVMNFGGSGIAYLFDCVEDKSAKFLWQC